MHKTCIIISNSSLNFKVYVGKRRADTSVAVAIKAIPKKHISVVQEHYQNGSAADVIKREVEIMLSVKHVCFLLLRFVSCKKFSIKLFRN